MLLVLDRTDDLDAALSGFVARAEGVTLDVIALVVLPDWSASQLELRTRAHARQVAAEVTSPTIHVSAEVGLDEPVTTVLETAARRGADLIAMTVRRAGVIERLLDHSVREKVPRVRLDGSRAGLDGGPGLWLVMLQPLHQILLLPAEHGDRPARRWPSS